MLQPTPPPSLASLPPELLLEIIPHIPYTPTNLTNLRLTNHTLNTLILTHEHSLIASTLRTQPHLRTKTHLFPGLAPTTYPALTTLHTRYETLQTLHNNWLTITCHGIELHWLRGRWDRIHKAGLLLLYRLHDARTYAAKLDLLMDGGLSASSLACLLFKLVNSVKILRVYGPEPVQAGWRREESEVRSEVELCCEECLLLEGPDFFLGLLRAGRTGVKGDSWAVRTLEEEIANMPARQSALPSGEPPPPTLISSLRWALAQKAGCAVCQTVSKMWEILSSTAFDEVDEEMMGRLVSGEEVKGGFKRMGF